ncbi:hypothetical protein PG984_008227 [Apiospora sp. TS-2023a]
MEASWRGWALTLSYLCGLGGGALLPKTTLATTTTTRASTAAAATSSPIAITWGGLGLGATGANGIPMWVSWLQVFGLVDWALG